MILAQDASVMRTWSSKRPERLRLSPWWMQSVGGVEASPRGAMTRASSEANWQRDVKEPDLREPARVFFRPMRWCRISLPLCAEVRPMRVKQSESWGTRRVLQTAKKDGIFRVALSNPFWRVPKNQEGRPLETRNSYPRARTCNVF